MAGMEGAKKETYLGFYFFKSNDRFYDLTESNRGDLAGEFKALLDYNRDSNRVDIRLFSCKGFREDADFVIWLISEDYETFNRFYTGFERKFGKYFSVTYLFQGMTKPSPYFKEERPQSFQMGPTKAKYVFIYPFAKTDGWYQISKEERNEMMREHREVATKFNRIYTNTCYAFGLGDHEFLLAFETDYPRDFSDLLQALRETKARIYTRYDIPIIASINKPEEEVIREVFLS